jgi:hypothetical protein
MGNGRGSIDVLPDLGQKRLTTQAAMRLLLEVERRQVFEGLPHRGSNRLNLKVTGRHNSHRQPEPLRK